MIWLPVKPLWMGLQTLVGASAHEAPAVVKVIEGAHLVSPEVGKALNALAQSVHDYGYSFTVLRGDLILALIVALIGKHDPAVKHHIGKIEATGLPVPIPAEPAPVAVALPEPLPQPTP